jgi:hypothetical protein
MKLTTTMKPNKLVSPKAGRFSPKAGRFNVVASTLAASLICTGIVSAQGKIVSGVNNTASDVGAVVVGGNDNTASANISVITGGAQNKVDSQGGVVIAGFKQNNQGNDTAIITGFQNASEKGVFRSAIVTGRGNKLTATAADSFIGAGLGNVNGGKFAAIVAGTGNSIGVNGLNSQAGGVKASANHPNSFVFNGNSAAPLTTTAGGQVLMAAPGGAKIIGDLVVTGTISAPGLVGQAGPAGPKGDQGVAGPAGNSVTGASIDPVTGNLILTLTDNTTNTTSTITAGNVREADFGSFGIAFTPIGNPNNDDDDTGYGQVAYEYSISTYEVSEAMIDAYNTANPSIPITKDNRGADKPATGVSWNEAARFVNWLNTSQGYQAAYKFTTDGFNDNIALWSSAEAWQEGGENLYRHKDAKYFLPSEDEWYKAAYYDPATSTYNDYATGSDTLPTAVASGTASGTAVYGGQSGPADINIAGGLSPYGTMAQSGNVFEWLESAFDGGNDLNSEDRVLRDGDWSDPAEDVQSSWRDFDIPAGAFIEFGGFRVAAVPE